MIVGYLRRLSSYSLLVHLLLCMIGLSPVEVAQKASRTRSELLIQKNNIKVGHRGRKAAVEASCSGF